MLEIYESELLIPINGGVKVINIFKKDEQLVKYAVISALGKIKSEKAIMFLLEVVENGNPHMINKIFSVFCENKLLTKELLTKLSHANNRYLRGFAALGFGEIGDCIWVLSLLRDKDPYVREKAAYAMIGNLNDPQTISKIKELLDNPDPCVRKSAVCALKNIEVKINIRQYIKESSNFNRFTKIRF